MGFSFISYCKIAVIKWLVIFFQCYIIIIFEILKVYALLDVILPVIKLKIISYSFCAIPKTNRKCVCVCVCV